VQHRDGLVDDVALFAQAGAVSGAAPSDHGFDPACPQQSAVGVVVVATVGEQPVRAATRPAEPTSDMGDRVPGRSWRI
jgi:hypothetical protein